MPKSRNRAWYRIENKAAPDEATVYLYDEIVSDDGYFGGVTAESFVRDLNALDVKTIHLRINSPGGSVFPAMAIYTALRQHPATVVAHVDGLAASAASFIALAAGEVRMTKGAFYMIHNGQAIAIGDKRAMQEVAGLLEKLDSQIVDIYAGASGMGADEVRAAMDAVTWYTAEEAKDAGFVDEIDEAEPVKAAFDLSRFEHVPEPLARQTAPEPEPRARPQTVREMEALLREEGGFSNAEAKRVASAAFEALTDHRDDGQPEPMPPTDADENATEALCAALLNARFNLRTIGAN